MLKVAHAIFLDWHYAMGRASASGKPSCFMLGDVRNHVFLQFLVARDMQSHISGVKMMFFGTALGGTHIHTHILRTPEAL